MKGLDGANHPEIVSENRTNTQAEAAPIAGSGDPSAGTSIWQDFQAAQGANGVSVALIKELISQLPCD